MTGQDSRYNAASKQDDAFRDRFVFVAMELDEAFETAITPNTEWTNRVQRIRAAVNQIGGNVERLVMCSMRASFNGAALIAADVAQNVVEEMIIFKGASPDVIQMVYSKAGQPSKAKGKLANTHKFGENKPAKKQGAK